MSDYVPQPGDTQVREIIRIVPHAKLDDAVELFVDGLKFRIGTLFDAANTCAISLTQATTDGPCSFQSDTTDDISLGKTGLPPARLRGDPDRPHCSGHRIRLGRRPGRRRWPARGAR